METQRNWSQLIAGLHTTVVYKWKKKDTFHILKGVKEGYALSLMRLENNHVPWVAANWQNDRFGLSLSTTNRITTNH